MNLENLISSKIQRTIEKTGEVSLSIVCVLLFFDYFGVFDLSKIPVPFLTVVLWGYLILNAGIVNMFKFIRTRDNPICPKCDSKLDELMRYECPNCGLNFEKKDKTCQK